MATYKDKFKEVFGVEPKDYNGFFACPSEIGIKTESECEHQEACYICAQKFWDSEYKEPTKE